MSADFKTTLSLDNKNYDKNILGAANATKKYSEQVNKTQRELEKLQKEGGETQEVFQKFSKTIGLSEEKTLKYGRCLLSCTKFLGGVAAAAGVAYGAFQTYDTMMQSNAVSAGKWNDTMGGLKETVDSFFTALKLGDWTVFENGIINAIRLSKKYQTALRELQNDIRLGDTQLSIYEKEAEEYKIIIEDPNSTKQEKEAAFPKYKEAIDKTIKHANDMETNTNNKIKEMFEGKGVKIKDYSTIRQDMLDYFSSYTDKGKSVRKYIDINDNIESLDDTINKTILNGGDASGLESQRKLLVDEKNALIAADKKLVEMVKAYANFGDTNENQTMWDSVDKSNDYKERANTLTAEKNSIITNFDKDNKWIGEEVNKNTNNSNKVILTEQLKLEEERRKQEAEEAAKHKKLLDEKTLLIKRTIENLTKGSTLGKEALSVYTNKQINMINSAFEKLNESLINEITAAFETYGSQISNLDNLLKDGLIKLSEFNEKQIAEERKVYDVLNKYLPKAVIGLIVNQPTKLDNDIFSPDNGRHTEFGNTFKTNYLGKDYTIEVNKSFKEIADYINKTQKSQLSEQEKQKRYDISAQLVGYKYSRDLSYRSEKENYQSNKFWPEGSKFDVFKSLSNVNFFPSTKGSDLFKADLSCLSDPLTTSKSFNLMEKIMGLSPEEMRSVLVDYQNYLQDFMSNISDILQDIPDDSPMKKVFQDMQNNAFDNTQNIAQAIGGIDETIEKNKKIQQWSDDNSQALGAVANMFGQISTATDGTAATILNFVGVSMQAVSELLPMIAKMIIAKNGEALASGTAEGAKMKFPMNLVAIATIVGTIASVFASIPKFANGGIIKGATSMGDYNLAKVNSGEMILNQTLQGRLFNMLNSGSSLKMSNMAGNVEFRIRGKELVGVLNNYANKINKVL